MQETAGHSYSSLFYDYTDVGAARSARRFVDVIQPLLGAASVADFGCGRGTWLREWQRSGVSDIVGIDGDYVVRSELKIPTDCFHAHDITQPVDLGRRFDLVQSLEVAEHLPAKNASSFIETLARHGDRVLFSAAVPGQGGEFHVNEQPMQYWRERFAELGYAPYDFVRQRLSRTSEVQPWYRFNTMLYANANGADGLPYEVASTRVDDNRSFTDHSDLAWKLRRAVVGRLPPSAVNRISQIRAEIIARRMR